MSVYSTFLSHSFISRLQNYDATCRLAQEVAENIHERNKQQTERLSFSCEFPDFCETLLVFATMTESHCCKYSLCNSLFRLRTMDVVKKELSQKAKLSIYRSI